MAQKKKLQVVLAADGEVGRRCDTVLREMGINPIQYYMWDRKAECDILLSVHWKEKFTQDVLDLCRIGAFNLHNSYLPWNKGANACTWAIIDQTPHGATFHWMNKDIDKGDIFLQKQIIITPNDTTDSLYQRTVECEVAVFKAAMGLLLGGARTRIRQRAKGTCHSKDDFNRLLRAMTTDKTIATDVDTFGAGFTVRFST